MSQSVTIALSEFALVALRGEEHRDGAQVSARMSRAIWHYLRDMETDRPGWRYPRFLLERERARMVELEFSIDPDLWRSFEREAGRQGVSVEQLAEHAALYFAAAVNAGWAEGGDPAERAPRKAKR